MTMEAFLEQTANVRPNPNQLRLLRETPFYVFVHFSPNTFTGLEWGTGKEDPAVFNPTALDCEQWARAIKDAGAAGMVLTAKHHDGFCLWQSAYTEHCMKNSPYKNGKGDVVREAADACRKFGLKFGFYLSPWDRHEKTYGTPAYNEFYKNQLRELLTNYGEIFHVWFDGACGEGENGKKQVYDFEGYIDLIRKYQPKATFFNDAGEVRWCGNESGSTGNAQWSVVPHELCFFNKEIQTGRGPMQGALKGIYNYDAELGAMSANWYSEGLVFSPAETDMSIRPGWFWHPDEEPHSLDRLFDTYLRTVGGNTTFNLNVPPTNEGLFDGRDVKRLHELGEKLRAAFGKDLAENAAVTVEHLSPTQPEIILRLPEKTDLHYIELQEDIAKGQRVELFYVYTEDGPNARSVLSGTTVGNKRIIPVSLSVDYLKIAVRAARGPVEDLTVCLY
ncbi:MAG: alpha-L-fucosidase [Clostridia bacterium]|nr:alpha-L-fucosidase [Clostridia bacterium]